MIRKSKLTADQLLAQENFSENLLSQHQTNDKVDENEILIAQQIYSSILTAGEDVTFSEKEQTKNQISKSVRRLSIKRALIRWSIAASVICAVIITAVGYYTSSPIPGIVNFAQSLNHIKVENSTRIILQNGEEILVDKMQSQIRYDKNGENILINAEQKVVQHMNSSKSVFNTILVPYGKRSQITLSEGTKIWLNSGSKLIYPAVFSENKREVYLDGEAIFDVMHSTEKPFIVCTKDFDIRVLGTVFNVSSYADDQYTETVLKQGKIELICNGTSMLSHKKYDINPGIMAVYDRKLNTLEKKEVNPEKYFAWREGYLILNSEKLENILTKLSRFYNIEMVISDEHLKNETFSGHLDLKNTPEEVLMIINQTTPLAYTIDHEKIIINTKKTAY